MTHPSPPAAPAERQSTVGRVRQMLAVAVVAAAVVAIPTALGVLVGWPLPSTIPTGTELASAFTDPLTSTRLVNLLAVLAWAAWGYFVVCLAAETVNATARRGRPPVRLPLGGLGQAGAQRLVAAVLLAGAATPLTLGSGASAASVTSGSAASWNVAGSQTLVASTDYTDPLAAHKAGTAAAAGGTSAQTQTTPGSHAAGMTPVAGQDQLRRYTVVPPAAGYHDNLWDIAAQHLGDPMRWTQIHTLNAGQPQPDGAALSDPDLVRPGWQLRMPADAVHLPAWDQPAQPAQATGTRQDGTSNAARVLPGADAPAPVHVVQPGDTLWQIAEDTLQDPGRYPELAAAASTVLQPDGRRLVDPDLIRPGWVIPLPPDHHANLAVVAPPTEQPDPAHPLPVPGPVLAPSADALERDALAQASGNAAPPRASGEARQPARPPASQHPPGPAQAATQNGETLSPAWMIASLTGAGAVLAGAMLIGLQQRRRAQARARRPGRALPAVPAALVPVDKTVMVAGSGSAPTLQHVDEVLRRLAAEQAARGEPMPAVAAVALIPTGLVLHLREPAQLGAGWSGTEDGLHWTLVTDVHLDRLGPEPADQPAPYPLLVTIGAADDGAVWLLNLEHAGSLTLTGDTTRGRDLARYLAAELACNPWSHHVQVDCLGIAEEIAPMNPERIRHHENGTDPAAAVLTHAHTTVDRATHAGNDVTTARAHQDGDDVWPARVLLLDAAEQRTHALSQLLDLVQSQPGRTGTCVVLTGSPATDDHPAGTVLQVSADGRLRLPNAPELTAVGLSNDEARGCAALYLHSEDLHDVPAPDGPEVDSGWRSYTTTTGALRPQHTVPRHTLAEQQNDPAASVLEAPDQDYLDVAATTEEDLDQVAPKVPTRVRTAVQDSDPALDDDVHAWFSLDCDLPRLSLLGPVGARTHGTPISNRKPYYTELLTYLATRPHGATPEETAEAFGITVTKTRDYIKTLRDWLGANPRTGQPHLPDARKSPAARARGVGVYQVEGLLVDADLFRRLRVRGQARGPDGITDLRQALSLVTGRPFDKLRPGGWAWLYDGDRLDQHLTCAIVDVAHLLTTHYVQVGGLAEARTTAQIATQAAPDEETPRLDLVAVTHAEGHHHAAHQILRDDVCNRTDDPDQPPTELPQRTQRIIDRHGWLTDDRTAS